MCTRRSHDGHDRRCRCCSPEGQRARRTESGLRERGYDGDIDGDYPEGKTEARAGLARDHGEATFDPSPTVRCARAREADLEAAEQQVLAGDEHPRVRTALSSNGVTEPAILDTLAADDSARVRAVVAQHPSTEPETLDALADDEDRAVRTAVAEHPATPAQSLDRMSRHQDSRHDLCVVRGIVAHPSTPTNTLGRLAQDGSRARRALARDALEERAQMAPSVAAG